MWEIRPYEDRDFGQAVEAWAEALPYDALTPDQFLRRVLLDPNREEGSPLLAVDGGGRVLGLALCLVLQRPIAKAGLMEHRGFISAFGVRPEARGRGIGAALLAAAEDFLRARGRKEVAIAPYPPGYFVPGVDKERYAEGLAFLKRRGYAEFVEAIAMDALIGQFTLDGEVLKKEEALRGEDIVVEPLGTEHLSAFFRFMRAEMPGDWDEDARQLLVRMTEGLAPRHCVYIARRGAEVLGYCKFDGEHFGPFGVSESCQGMGIGSVLLARTLLQMRLEGHHSAYVLWTGERAAKGVYGRLGFKVTRRFAIVRKSLEHGET